MPLISAEKASRAEGGETETPPREALSLSALYAPIRDDLQAAVEIFDDELLTRFPFINDLCETIRSYRGKMLRPALLLLSGKAAGQLNASHHTMAAVVEMVHMATLVHDDVLDEAEERRRKPAVRKLAGNTAAVLLGDYLISHAFHLCSSVPGRHASRRIGDTTNRVCEGELLQNHRQGDLSLTEADYLEMIRRKTGALTGVCCELGAHYAGADASTTAALHAFGEAAGVAFQIVDDCLDVRGDESAAGKTLGRDFSSGKLTLPTIHCLANGHRPATSLLRRMLDDHAQFDRDRLRRLLEETGSVDYAIALAESFVSDARRHLDLLPPTDARASLIAMTDFILRRSF